MNQFGLKSAVSRGRYEWRLHMIERMAEREILQDEILKILKKGIVIEDYPDDKPYPSALFFGKILSKPLHAVAAFDEENDWVYIITAYIPDMEHFEKDYKTRRKS